MAPLKASFNESVGLSKMFHDDSFSPEKAFKVPSGTVNEKKALSKNFYRHTEKHPDSGASPIKETRIFRCDDLLPDKLTHYRASCEEPVIGASAEQPRLSDKIFKLRPSLTLELKQIVLKRRRQNKPVFDFGLGETKGHLSQTLKNEAFQAVSREDTYYTHPAGMPEVRRSVLKWLNLESSYSEDNVVVSGGAKQCLLNTFLAICNPGDTVLLSSCPWVSYAPLAYSVHATPVVVRPLTDEQGLRTTPDDLERAIDSFPGAKLFLLNNPCNPTGQVYTKQEQDALLDICVKNRIYFVLDRLYWKIVYGAEEFPEPKLTPETKPWIIQVDGLSKNFRRAGGLRAGWTVADDDVSAAMANLQSHHSSGASTITQKVVAAALNAEYDDEMVRDLDRKRAVVQTMTVDIPHVEVLPMQGAFYSFWNVRAALGKTTPGGCLLSSADDVARYLLDEFGVVTASGTGFYQEGFLRLSYHIPMHEIKGGLEAARKAFSELR